MPIKIPDELPARDVLEEENIFVMNEERALRQDIRPLKVAILNLMPLKIVTENQILRLLGNTPLQVDIILVHPASHNPNNTAEEHLRKFYTTFSGIKDQKFDGLIITGAPVEHLDFARVDYWDELRAILDWSRHNVFSTLHICWGAQAGLYHHYGIPKHPLAEKLFGVFEHTVTRRKARLVRGFDPVFWVPHSRYTEVREEDIEMVSKLKVLSRSDQAGVHIVAHRNGRQIFVTGHGEYDRETLKYEYERDRSKGLDIKPPVNYFPEDDPTREPRMNWQAHAHLMFSNWLNYCVYQRTPYDLNQIR